MLPLLLPNPALQKETVMGKWYGKNSYSQASQDAMASGHAIYDAQEAGAKKKELNALASKGNSAWERMEAIEAERFRRGLRDLS
ncbi:hypothetical protein [Pseudonocardia sp. GCM10023141]|uniref:hypothetical protein n=1 Tax=Pseudonocardia sp. GCM10023141 TaxID=3252653 RepID=UPI003617B049